LIASKPHIFDATVEINNHSSPSCSAVHRVNIQFQSNASCVELPYPP
jgi:hypothetical protein